MFKLIVLATSLAGCIHLDPDPADTTSSDTGAVEVALAGAPEGIDCIDFTFANEDGVTTDAARALTNGTLVIRDLAAGSYSLSAVAYGSGQPAPITDADCSAVPAAAPWVTEQPIDLVLVASQRTNTTLRLVPAGRAGVTPVFVDTPHVLARAQGALGLIAVANGTVAFIHTGNATSSEIRRVADTDLGAVDVLATAQTNPSEIVATDSGDVYWTNFITGARDADGNRLHDGSVWGYIAGAPQLLRDGIQPSDIARLADNTVVWGEQDTNSIGCSGCTGAFAVTPGSPNAVGAAGTHVYFDNATTDDVLSVDAGGVPVVLANTAPRVPIGITATDTEVFWTDFVNTTGLGGVLKAPATGGSVTILVDNIAAGFPIAVLDGFVYWADGGRLARVPTGGGDSEDVVVGPIGGFAVSHDDDGHGLVYWTDNSHGGLVWRARVN